MPKEIIETKAEVLALLVRIQEDCAPIKLSIGHVCKANFVNHDSITIHDAPPVVLRALVNAGLLVQIVEDGGVRIIFPKRLNT